MSKATSSSPDTDNVKLFQPVRSYEKVVLALLGVVALIGFIILLVHYAQPTPPGLGVESRQSKMSVSPVATVPVQAGTVSSSGLGEAVPTVTVSSGTSPTTASSTSTATSLQPATTSVRSKATNNSLSNSLMLDGGVEKVTEPLKKVLITLPLGNKSSGLSL